MVGITGRTQNHANCMSVNIQSKLPDVGTNIFTVMSALAQEHQAINLGQGFPDFPMNQELVEKVAKAMRDGFNQYVPMQGYLPLRQSISAKAAKLYETRLDPETQITVTPGGTYAIYTAFTTILQPGDEVIVFEPAYDSYIPNIEINGGVAVRIPLPFPDFRIDWDRVKKAVNPKTRAIIINSPHNPTGSVWDREDIEALRAITAGTRIIIISDEVYEHLIFDGKRHESIIAYPDLLKRSFVCFSFGKVYNCTGWKLGYAIASASLMAEFRKVHQFNAFSCNSPVQVALADFLANEAVYKALTNDMQERRNFFVEEMRFSRFDLLNSSGSYFVCARYDKISTLGDLEFCRLMVKEAGVAAIPVSAFYKDGTDHHIVRFCFGKKAETISAAVKRLITL